MRALLLIGFMGLILFGCAHEKLPLPNIPPAEDQYANVGKETYVQLNPPLDKAHGYDFSKPSDIYLGADNFLYIADTGNDRIVMMDLGGGIQGVSQYIPHPQAITQNDSLQLLIVNKTNAIYRIDLVKYQHRIWEAPVEKVFEQSSEPSRQFTGITVHTGFEYYVTVIDTADSSTNYKEFSFIYDFSGDHTLKGPLPMHVNGTGLYSAIVPTGIVSLRERYLDVSTRAEDTKAFIFTQTGRTRLLRNNFKVQYISSYFFEGSEFLTPNTDLIGTDIYDPNKFYNPEDVAVDRLGFIFVVDEGRKITDPDTTKPLPGFYRFSPSGKQLQAVLGLGSGEKQFNGPKGIAVLPFLEDQIVYVADTGNDRILMFQLSTQF
ncbi:MAG: hypothetical protein GXO78_06060 [Calditrichaeota bacterium]|nr:hypothetical protein [Calditrichota bacterium]